MKKITSIFLVLALLLTLASCGSQGSTDSKPIQGVEITDSNVSSPEQESSKTNTEEPSDLTPSNGIQYEISADGEGYAVSWVGQCKDEVVVVPDTYEGKPVIGINFGAFSMCRWITHIYLPDTITYIGDFAFEQCESLVYVDLPQNLLEIGKKAFFRCSSLESVVLPQNVKSLDETFYECEKLKEVIMPSSIAWINNNLFVGCPIKAVQFTSYTEWSILDNNWKEYKLNDASAMAEYFAQPALSTFSPTNLFYTDEQGVVYNINGHMDTYFYATVNRTNDKTISEYTVPAEIHGIPVESIDGNAFSDCTMLKSLFIPASIRMISAEAMKNCSILTNLTFEQPTNWKSKNGNDVDLSVPENNANILNEIGYIEVPKAN